jgi:glycosyltransferase involved in cell wall biosynthesis
MYSDDPLHMHDADGSTSYVPERPLRIVIVAGALSGGGAERQLLQLATELHKLGHEITVATIAHANVATEFRQIELWNARRRSRAGTLWGLARALFRLRRLCSAERPDVVIGWLSIPIILASLACGSRRIPFVAALRGSRPERLSGRYRQIIQHAILRRGLLKAGLTVANSQAGIDGYAGMGLIDRNQTRVIRNGVNSDEFQRPIISSADAARAGLAVTHKGPLALYVGRIAEEKDISLLVRVVHSSLDCRQDLGWLIVGFAPEPFLAIASELHISIPLDRVHFIPRLRTMALAYNASSFLCLTSKYEGSPNCVLEARACGLPVISTDCGDVRECMCPDDHIVAAHPASFTNAINNSLLPKSGQQRHNSQPMSINECAKQWLAALRSVVDNRAKVTQVPL